MGSTRHVPLEYFSHLVHVYFNTCGSTSITLSALDDQSAFNIAMNGVHNWGDNSARVIIYSMNHLLNYKINLNATILFVVFIDKYTKKKVVKESNEYQPNL